MKKKISIGKLLILLLCTLPLLLSTTACGDDDDGSIARISEYTTTPPRDVTLPARARFIGFGIESTNEWLGYTIGYAIIENGIRTDNILYEFDPMTMPEFMLIECGFIISGNFFGEEITIQHRQSGEGWTYTSDAFLLEMPGLTGYKVLTRPAEFDAGLLPGNDVVIAAAIGSVDNEILRPLTIEFFDNFRTIDDALADQNLADRPFLLLFYVTAHT